MSMLTYEDLEKMIKKANRRLDRLAKFSGKDVSWAGKRLQSYIDNGKLNAWKNNRIYIDRSMSVQELQRIYIATDIFLKNNTSTITGVKHAIKSAKHSLGSTFNIGKNEAESLYQLITDDTFLYIKEHSNATSSEIWAVVQEAKERRFTYAAFEKRLKEIAEVIPDEEMKKHIEALFMSEVLGVK